MFNLNLFARFLKDHWRSGATIAFSLFIYALMISSIAPQFLDDPAIKALVSKYPKTLLALAAGTSGPNFFTPEGFWSTEFLQLWWVVIVGGAVIAYSAGIISTDMDLGTIEYLLTQPVRRSALIISRFAGVAAYLLMYVLVTIGSIAGLTAYFGAEVKIRGLFAVGFNAFLFVLAVAALTLLFSLAVKGRGRAVVYGVAFLLASHLLNALALINSTVEKFQWLSLFNYYQTQKLLTTGKIIWGDAAVIAGAFAVCAAASVILFNRKDIAVD